MSLNSSSGQSEVTRELNEKGLMPESFTNPSFEKVMEACWIVSTFSCIFIVYPDNLRLHNGRNIPIEKRKSGTQKTTAKVKEVLRH
jgi:hypothetical protein